jgi:hypothetical protein
MMEMSLSNMLAFEKTKSSFSDLYIYIYIDIFLIESRHAWLLRKSLPEILTSNDIVIVISHFFWI